MNTMRGYDSRRAAVATRTRRPLAAVAMLHATTTLLVTTLSRGLTAKWSPIGNARARVPRRLAAAGQRMSSHVIACHAMPTGLLIAAPLVCILVAAYMAKVWVGTA
jgi:hypothetical protein